MGAKMRGEIIFYHTLAFAFAFEKSKIRRRLRLRIFAAQK
jgi:hypothetical protein